MEKYGTSVIQIAHLAQSLQKHDHNINIELQISCENLPKTDTLGFCDPVVFLYVKNEENNWHLIGHTEIVPADLNPKFFKTFILPFSFSVENILEYKLEIYDADEISLNDIHLEGLELIGTAEFTDHSVMDSRQLTVEIDTSETYKTKSHITLTATEYESSNCRVVFELSGRDFVSKYGIFVRVQAQKGRDWQLLAYSNVVENKADSDSAWQLLEVEMNKFINEDSTIIRIKVCEYSKKGISEIGVTEEYSLGYCINLKGDSCNLKIVKAGLLMGVVVARRIEKISIRSSFLNYIYSGNQFNLMIAIDFSSSNAPIHTRDWGSNLFIHALRNVVGLFQYFDRHGSIRCYGFGALLPPRHTTMSNLFSLNGNFFNPNISEGIDRVIEHYKETLQKVRLHGPSILSEVIDVAIQDARYSLERVREKKELLQYTVMIVLTDGHVSDEELVKEKIVTASDLPISIIMICVGDSYSKILSELDADAEAIYARRLKKQMARDIVQHLHYRDYIHESTIMLLPYEILHEIPQQYLTYMESINYHPISNMKKLKEEFFNEKANLHLKKRDIPVPGYLTHLRALFQAKSDKLTGRPALVQEVLDKGIMSNNLQYMIELVGDLKRQARRIEQPQPPRPSTVRSEVDSEFKDGFIQGPNIKHKVIRVKQFDRLHQVLKKKRQQNYEQTIIFLHRLQKTTIPQKITLPPEPHVKEKQNLFRVSLDDYQVGGRMCVVCKAKPVQVVYLPCGHSCCCADQYLRDCPVCRLRVIEQAELKG